MSRKPHTEKRRPPIARARKAKADFIRWARNNPDRAWIERGSVCWVRADEPSQLLGNSTGYVFSRSLPGIKPDAYQDLHDTGIVSRVLRPMNVTQFWRSLPRKCADLGVEVRNA